MPVSGLPKVFRTKLLVYKVVRLVLRERRQLMATTRMRLTRVLPLICVLSQEGSLGVLGALSLSRGVLWLTALPWDRGCACLRAIPLITPGVSGTVTKIRAISVIFREDLPLVVSLHMRPRQGDRGDLHIFDYRTLAILTRMRSMLHVSKVRAMEGSVPCPSTL